ncbi:hypothetical protein AAZX31_10G133400 [Glycine max]|uniref:Uncharacterized protein n=2 Tax=Glycine subgen. Soja TaxID=1462606 RepID=K7LJD6_SOYBN|nr:hypothetical protein JHK87_028059 [Glycine soja]KAG4997375.1 hypothetical protein JHK85_028814 [Glycine max]KAG5127314.1 hypothetical protein JHK82_028149 [Glycine max]KAG5151928.1 hypothetical protein JHK84_028400 [Glycine max]KRH33728.1 hypothetical protein GLYMA_10G142300v4 [Glycine max]
MSSQVWCSSTLKLKPSPTTSHLASLKQLNFSLFSSTQKIFFHGEWTYDPPECQRAYVSISVLYAKLTDKGGAERKRCSKLVRA